MESEKKRKFFSTYTLVILILAGLKLAFGNSMNNFWQGTTAVLIVLLSGTELILMKVLK